MAAAQANPAPERQRVSVQSVLPPHLQPLIPHLYFTPMQSQSLSTWRKQHNILISAPTGSGKSICFDLAILRMIHLKKSTSPKEKVLFLAPIKSICNERAYDWKRRLAKPLGLRVDLLVGNVNVETTKTADIIVATAEKWDSLLRTEDENSLGFFKSFISEIGLLLIDEIHHIGNPRGKTLELVISRMLMASEIEKNSSCFPLEQRFRKHPISSLRIIAVSATVGNPEDLARWLRVPIAAQNSADINTTNSKEPVEINRVDDLENGLLVFDETYRPVPLNYIVLGYHAVNQWQVGKEFDKNILSVLRQYSEGKPTIVFCTSRLQTISAAESLLNKLQNKSDLLSSFTNEKRELLNKYTQECEDAGLKRLLSAGIAFHNADMSESVQNLVEKLLHQSLIICLFSTSTLAQGVNFPIRLVVIYGTAIYDRGTMKQYDPNLVLQMCGRAGRQGLDECGVSVIMTERDTVYLYQNMGAHKMTSIYSQLTDSLDECVNVEVARGAINDFASAKQFLTNTFSWVSMPETIDSNDNSSNEENNNSVQDLKQTTSSTQIVANIANRLAASKLIEFEPDEFSFYSSALGGCMARFNLSLKSTVTIVEQMHSLNSVNKVLNLLTTIDEVSADVVIRRNEKKCLNELNERIRVRVEGRVNKAHDKVKVLLQSYIECKERHDETWGANIALYNESERIMRSANRVCRAMFNIIFITYPSIELMPIITTIRSILSCCARDTISIIRHHIGPQLLSYAQARVLVRNGLNTVSKLCDSDSGTIGTKLRSSSTLAEQILRRARRLPSFYLRAVVFRDSGGGGRVIGLDLRFCVFCRMGTEQMKGRKTWSGFIFFIDETSTVLYSRRFKLCDVVNGCQIIRNFPDQAAKWVDVLIGCENVLGLDQICRFAEGGRNMDHGYEIPRGSAIDVGLYPAQDVVNEMEQGIDIDRKNDQSNNLDSQQSSEIPLHVFNSRISKEKNYRRKVADPSLQSIIKSVQNERQDRDQLNVENHGDESNIIRETEIDAETEQGPTVGDELGRNGFQNLVKENDCVDETDNEMDVI